MYASLTISIFKKKITVRVIYFLVLFLMAGTFIRFYNLTYTSLWLDEIYSMKGADVASSLKEVYEYSKHDQPPLFFVLLHGWLKLFGYTDYAGRALTCIFGLLGILSIYFLGKEVKNEQVGIFASFITTLNWFHTGISVEMRFYSLVFLLSTLSYLFFIRALKSSRIVDLSLYALFTSLLLNTHYFGLVLYVSQLIIFISNVMLFKRKIRFVIPAVAAGLLAGISILHWTPVIFHDLQITSFHIKPLTLRYVLKFLWWYIYDPATFIIFLIFAFLAIKNTIKKIQEKTFETTDLVVVGWLVIGFLIPLVYSLVRIPLFTNKYCTIQVPVIFLFIAMGFALLKNNRLKAYSIVAIALSALVVLFFARPQYKKSFHEDGREIAIMYFNAEDAGEKSWNEDWREVAGYFQGCDTTRQVIFSQLAWFHEYYFKKNNLKVPVDQNVCDFKEQIKRVDRVWLLLHAHYLDSSPIVKFSQEQQSIIRSDFELSDLVHFKKSKALLYVRKKNG